MTFGTGRSRCSWLSTAAVTGIAHFRAVYLYLTGNALAGLHKGKVETDCNISAALGSVGVCASGGCAAHSAAEEGIKNITEIKALTRKSAEAAHSACSCTIRRVNACVAELVIALTLLRVRENIVGFINLFEFFRRFRVVGMQVRVILLCHFSVGFLYFIIRSALGNTQHFIVITFFCHKIIPFVITDFPPHNCALCGGESYLIS